MRGRFVLLVIVVLVSAPLHAQHRRRAVAPPAPLTRDAIIATITPVADRVTWTTYPRLHWENAVFFDGLVRFGESVETLQPGAGSRFIERAGDALLHSDDPIATIPWADGTAFAQAVLDLYRFLPADDPRRASLLATLDGPMQFAEHAIRVTPQTGPPRDPWWMEGGYGGRFWQDDLYMVVPWLALHGSTADGLPGNALARDLAYEWIEAYAFDHRPVAGDALARSIPSERVRQGAFLLDQETGLFHHDPDAALRGDAFWGRGNGWALVALLRAAAALDAPYAANRFERVLSVGEMREIFGRAAATLVDRRTADGGWGSDLSDPDQCGVAETSATALLTFVLAGGVNQGWLDRDTYVPVILDAYKVLMRRVAFDGTVLMIQPPGIGMDCNALVTSAGEINVNYAPGAILLATAEVLRFTPAEIRENSQLPDQN